METNNVCELCKEEAFIYCSADVAFLCWNCDFKVHHANFLVARHLRLVLCRKCKSFCQLEPLQGCHFQYFHHLCKVCSSKETYHAMPPPSPPPPSSSSSSSTTESSSNHFKPKRVLIKSRSLSLVFKIKNTSDLDSILKIWCKKLGLKKHYITPKVVCTLQLCLERLIGLSLRISLAVAFWHGLRMNQDTLVASWQYLRRLEEISGVSAKLIVSMESRLTHAWRLRRRIRPNLKQGWAKRNI